MSKERRKYPRIVLQQLFEMSLGKETFVAAHSVNISEGGIYCETSKELEVHARVYLMLIIVDKTGESEVQTEGIVLRTEKKKGKYYAAIEFIEMQDEDKEKIQNFLKQSA
jgi:c-di-GMP-binding flagellar brake protein YcgR